MIDISLVLVAFLALNSKYATEIIMTIIAINAGSSSLKISVFEKDSESQIADAEVSNITSDKAKVKYVVHGDTQQSEEQIKDHAEAFRYILDRLTQDSSLPELNERSDISLAVHRIVHGGDYTSPQTIDKDTMHKLEELTDLAPLHNATALEIVRVCTRELPESRNVAVFDTQFHQTIPEHVRTIPIDQKIAQENKLRKYGFHGISYAYITTAVAKFLKKDVSELNIIALHLGSGASGCAIKQGKSVNTTMSLTPLDGLPGSSRSGSVDPSLVFHYAANVGKLAPSSTSDLHISRAEEILNKESGWKAMTGTADFGEIGKRDTKEKQLAFDLMVDRIAQYVGSYYVSLQGKCDALVFAGGMGEKAVELRQAVVDQVRCLGFADLGDAKVDGTVTEISTGSGIKVLVCKTDEAHQMVVEVERV